MGVRPVLTVMLLATIAMADVAPATQSIDIPEIQDHLRHANVFKHGDVHVSYAKGVATLAGNVDSVGVKMDAQNAALKDEDVTQVVNDIRVSDAGVTPQQVLDQARRRLLTCYAYTIYDNVDLKVRGNTLTLSGEVTQPYRKDAIAYSLSHIKGVGAIENLLTVLPLSTYNEDLRARVARAIYDDPYFASYVDAGRLPIHIIVNDAGITLAGCVDSQVDRTRAEGDARIAASASDTIFNYLKVGNPEP